MIGAGRLDAELTEALTGWPVRSAGVLVLDRSGVVGAAGDVTSVRPWASVTKLLTALTALHAVAGGVVALEEPAGPPGATLRHLLAHASGLALDSDERLAVPGRRRIYSNRGIEIVAEHVEQRAGLSFSDLLARAVLAPLGLERTTLQGSPAHGASGPVTDLGLLAQELLHPRTLAPELVTAATTVAFPGLGGVLPGFGRQEPNDWGIGFEIRGDKIPHWTSGLNARTTFRSLRTVWLVPLARPRGGRCLRRGQQHGLRSVGRRALAATVDPRSPARPQRLDTTSVATTVAARLTDDLEGRAAGRVAANPCWQAWQIIG